MTMEKIEKIFTKLFFVLTIASFLLLGSQKCVSAATRFYLPSTGTPSISPATDGSWELTTGYISRNLVRTKISSSELIQSTAHNSSNGTDDVLIAQYISEDLPAGAISGTVKGVTKARSTNAAADLRTQIVIKVVSSDGSTVRGTLLSHDTGSLTSEWSTSGTLNSRLAPVALRTNTLSSVTAQANDHIVIEIGYRRHATVSTSYTGRLYFQDNASDLPESDSDTTTGDPWIEFSQDIFPSPTHTVEQGSWRWYSDSTPDGSMTALANENSAPTLTSSQMQNASIRLRTQIIETGGASGSGGVVVQYGGDGTNWNSLPAPSGGTGNQPNYWFRFADGTATGGNAVTSQLLSGTTESGKYHEDTGVSASVGASATHELDLTIGVRWPTPSETVKFRILYNGVPLTGGTEITLITSSVSDRPYTIDRAPVNGKTSSDIGKSAWPRQFYDGTRWWFFTKDESSANNLRYYYWDGPGNNWSAASTLDMGASGTDGRHSVAMATVSGVTHFYVHWGSSNSVSRFRRGIVSGTTITWDATQTLTQARRSHHHISVDDGGYVWAGGVKDNGGTPENLWVRRATNTDSVSAWESEVTITDASITAAKVVAIVGLASNRALVIWHSVDSLKYAVVSSTSVVSSGTIANPTRREDWGVTRSNGYVYLVHTDANDDTGDWVLQAFDEGSETWSTGPTWVKPVESTPSTDDGIAVVAVGNDIYAVGTFEGDWASDRVLYYQKYTGPGAGGSWSAGLTAMSPSGRGNGDRISPPLAAGNNLLLFTFDFADDDLDGNANAVEYHYLDVTPPTLVSVTMTSDGTVSYGTVAANQSKSTLDITDTQIVKNDGNVAEDFNIKTTAPAGWSLGASALTDTFVHEFSTNSGSNWTKFTTANSYQSLISNIAANGTQNLDLRFTAPNPSTSFTEKTLTVTVQAVEH